MKWNESGFRPPLCTYRLNWARRTSWGWCDDWDDTALQCRARYLPVTEAPHNTDLHTWMGRNIFCFFQTAETGTEPQLAAVLTTTLGPPPAYLHVSKICLPNVGNVVAMSVTLSCFLSVKRDRNVVTLWQDIQQANKPLVHISMAAKYVLPMLALCLANVCDAGPTLSQHWKISVSAEQYDFLLFFISWFILRLTVTVVSILTVLYITTSRNATRYDKNYTIRYDTTCHDTIVRGHYSISGGGGVSLEFLSFCRGQFFSLDPFQNIYCLYRAVIEVDYLFHAGSSRNYLFQKYSSHPPPPP